MTAVFFHHLLEDLVLLQLEVRELVEVTLRVEDYRILQAESGEEAVEIVKAEKPDLIIMDVMMPGGMDGLAATRIIKNSPNAEGCKVIMLTAKKARKGTVRRDLKRAPTTILPSPSFLLT